MAARCEFKYYKRFLNRRLPSNLSQRQLNKLGELTEAQQSKFVASMSEFDDETANALNIISQAAPQRFAQTTNKGLSMAELAARNQDAAAKLLDSIPVEERATLQQIGENLALGVERGRPLSVEERSIAFPAFANRMHNLPLLLKQFRHASETGNQAAMALLAKELVLTMGVAAGMSGDKNAASVALNSYKYFKKQMQVGKEINQLFQNGAC